MFLLEPGGYAQNNAFWKSASIAALARDADQATREKLAAQDARIRDRYQHLSDSYQSGKNDNAIPLN
ncbi:hypothetical protein D3C72_2298860 [compost metagenome]